MMKKKKLKKLSFRQKKRGIFSLESELMKQPVELKQGGAESSNQVVICKFTGCHDMSTVGLYCRLHYLMAWRKMKGKEARRKGKELNIYLKELAQKFPEDFLEKLKII